MCGRYASIRDPSDLTAEFDAEAAYDDLPGMDYNVAPTKPVWVVRARHSVPARVLTVMRWGLVPSWAQDPSVGSRLLNARAETVTELPAFRAAAERRRALVPADGWYEWRPHDDRPGKQAYYLTPRDGAVVAFAGLYEFWPHGERPLPSTTIVTTAALGGLADVHDRMPLMLPRERWADWLDPGRADPSDLLTPAPELVDAIEMRPVGPAVGNVANNGPELQRRAEDPTPLVLF